jgi:hypothetical protein
MKKKSHVEWVASCVLVVLCTALPVCAGITNGDFSTPGLYGWMVEYGTVTDGGGFALFEEDAFDLSSTLSQQFTISALALELSFDVVMSSDGDYESWPDAFMASLLDPVTFDPLVSNPGVGVTDFYYLDNTGYEETVATVSGNKVILDVSGFRGLDALLSFDLWASADGMTTTVNLDNVNITVIPAPGALLLGLIGMGTVGLWRKIRHLA